MLSIVPQKNVLAVTLAGLLSLSIVHETKAQTDFGFNFGHVLTLDGLPESVGVGDVNNDGLNDLVVVNNSFSNLSLRNHVLVYEQDENGALS